MKKILIIIGLVSSLLLDAQNLVYKDYDNTYDCFIIVGTSNCGRSRATTGGTGQFLPADSMYWAGVKDSVKIYNYIIGYSWQTLNVGTNTKLYNASNADEFGFESSFGKYYSDYNQKRVYIYKLGIGSSILAGQWMPGYTNWIAFVRTLDSAFRDANVDGVKLKICGFILQMGENDAVSQTNANNYQSNVKIFCDSTKLRLLYYANKYNHVISNNYKIVNHRINSLYDGSQVYGTTVRTAITNYSTDYFTVGGWVNLDSYTLYDNVHTDAKYQLDLGYRDFLQFKNRK